MSVIKLEIPVDKDNIAIVSDFLNRLAVDSGKASATKVVDAEEVKTEAPAKAPAQRASRAKPKAPPVEEEIEEEDDDFDDEEEEKDSPVITIDHVREMQSKKVQANKPALIEKLRELGAKGIATLEASDYKEYYDFMAKLK